jgi:hypothetical protein
MASCMGRKDRTPWDFDALRSRVGAAVPVVQVASTALAVVLNLLLIHRLLGLRRADQDVRIASTTTSRCPTALHVAS